MTGSHSRLGISDRESRMTGVIRAYDTGLKYTPRRAPASRYIQSVNGLSFGVATVHSDIAFGLSDYFHPGT